MSDQSVVTDYFVRKRSRRPITKGIESGVDDHEESLVKTSFPSNKRMTRSSAKQVARSRAASPVLQGSLSHKYLFS